MQQCCISTKVNDKMSQKREMVAQVKRTNPLPFGSDATVKHYMNSLAQLAVVVTLALSIMAAPTSAAEAGATQKTEAKVAAQAETNASVNGFQGLMVSIDQRLKTIQQKLTSIETRLAALEAKVNGKQAAKADVNAANDADVNADVRNDAAADAGDDADAQADVNAGATVTHSVQTGAETEAGVGARVEHRVEKDGETLVDFVIGELFGRAEKADINVSGEIEPGNQVVVTVTHDGEPAANASVYVNGELEGPTDTNGQIEVTVPDSERLRIVAKSDGFQAHATYDVEVEAEAGMELSSTMEEDADPESDAQASQESETGSSTGSSSDTESEQENREESSGSAESSASVHAEARFDVS